MKARFFKPFVGSNYKAGVNGKRVLVVGASFYCTGKYWNEDVECACGHFDKCTDVKRKDSSRFDRRCPCYEGTKWKLEDAPTESIEAQYRAYTTFGSLIGGVIGTETYEETWSRMAFTNYVQFFLPAEDGKMRPTYMSDLSERDFEAFNETLRELEPDIVILWGTVINGRTMWENEFLVDRGELERSGGYVCRVRLSRMRKDITLLNCYHPMSPKWNTDKVRFEAHLMAAFDY